MDKSYIDEYEAFEQHHWWHAARREIIHSFLHRYTPAQTGPRWLDIGCGTGVLLHSFKDIADKMGVELDPACVERGRAKGLSISTTDVAWDFRAYGTFDLITMCDVIEHLQNEREAIDAALDALKPGGIALVTVPALKCLWSSHDEINHHYRRYDEKQLSRLFDPEKWEILRSSYFCSLLFPLIWAARTMKKLRQRWTGAAPDHDFSFGPGIIDTTLYHIFRTERRLLQMSDLPVGSSLIVVARRR